MQRRVVIFEDDEINRTLLKSLLQQRGYEVISAADPLLCPIYLSLGDSCPHDQTCSDFLLTDNRMPLISGLDFIETHCQRGCTGEGRRKAVISASWTFEERQRAENLGCKTFTKPYNLLELTDWLQEQEQQIPPGRTLYKID